MRDGNDAMQSALAWVTRDILPKGVPIPRTGGVRSHGNYGGQRSRGVSGNSHILSHRYPIEGDKGPVHRRAIRRAETALWHAEVWEALQDYCDGIY